MRPSHLNGRGRCKATVSMQALSVLHVLEKRVGWVMKAAIQPATLVLLKGFYFQTGIVESAQTR